MAGDDEQQHLAASLLANQADLECPDTVLHSLYNTPSCSLLTWSLAPQPTPAILPANDSAPEPVFSLADAHVQCRYCLHRMHFVLGI